MGMKEIVNMRDPHGDSEEGWASMADSVADRIMSDIRPTTILHLNCGEGSLVGALRRRGAEAFGVDASEAAVKAMHEDVRPFCWVSPLTESLPQEYDLIVCVEVLQHLSPDEARRMLANVCQHTNDVLFSARPLYCADASHFNIQPLEHWATLFVHHGLFHDVDFDASFVTPWAARFRRTEESVIRVIDAYERRLWRLKLENAARRELNMEQRAELTAKEDAVLSAEAQLMQSEAELAQSRAQLTELATVLEERNARLRGWENRWAGLEASVGWALLQRLQHCRARLAPPGSDRDQVLEAAIQLVRHPGAGKLAGFVSLARGVLSRQMRARLAKTRVRPGRLQGEVVQIEPVRPRPPVQIHQATADIIVCVHNALSDVKRCLESVVRHTSPPYSLILVDDGSGPATSDYLRQFAGLHKATLLTNEEARGYTRAANQGLRKSSAEYVVLLNSDTVVTPEWLDRLVACAESDPQIGMVGPLSSTASWQSIPEIEFQGDWAANPLPAGVTPADMAGLVARHSARLYPRVPFLNGFCLLIHQRVIRELGCLDEESFGDGYGEENDYAIRARNAGWVLAVADDAYVYHAQSRSYSDAERKRLSEQASDLLIRKHGRAIVERGVAICRRDRVLEGIRARSRAMLARQDWIESGRDRFSGSRVLFVLPIAQAGGGANVVIDEAQAMREMGVDARIFNLMPHREAFERAYPALEIATVYGQRGDLVALAHDYDAIVATYNPSVEWMAPIRRSQGRPVRGYYVQDFEPYMYPSHSDGFRRAWESYSLFPDMVRFAKTEWTRQEVRRQIGVETQVVGCSVNLELFRPRPRPGPEWPDRPLRIAAMVRPMSPYRAPGLTMELLQRASSEYQVQPVVFGTEVDDPGFAELPKDFHWELAGILNREQVARLLNDVDIFVDFSSHQAMGLTAMEAMACGVAVTVPELGGTGSFARHEQNSLVVDTSSSQRCWDALQRLIEDRDLRVYLQRNALTEVCDFFPERPAFNILKALLDSATS